MFVLCLSVCLSFCLSIFLFFCFSVRSIIAPAVVLLCPTSRSRLVHPVAVLVIPPRPVCPYPLCIAHHPPQLTSLSSSIGLVFSPPAHLLDLFACSSSLIITNLLYILPGSARHRRRRRERRGPPLLVEKVVYSRPCARVRSVCLIRIRINICIGISSRLVPLRAPRHAPRCSSTVLLLPAGARGRWTMNDGRRTTGASPS